MERRDYILDQIQEMGAFLARLVSRLRKKEEGPSDQLSSVTGGLKNELGLDLDELLFLDEESFIAVLEEKLLAREHFEQFAGLLEQLGDMALNNETFLRQQIYYTKSLVLLSYVEVESKDYSMERQDKMADIRLKLMS